MFEENAIGNVTLGKIQREKRGGWKNSGKEGLPVDRPVEYAGTECSWEGAEFWKTGGKG